MAHTTTQLQQKQNNAPETTEKYDAVGEEMERHRKRRKRKKPEKQTVQEETKDPLEVFGTDIMLKILSNLDARSVALCLLVSRAWHAVASSDRLWAPKVGAPFSFSHLNLPFLLSFGVWVLIIFCVWFVINGVLCVSPTGYFR
jgi:hypothetical protein